MKTKSTILALFMGASTAYAQFSPRAAVDYFVSGNNVRIEQQYQTLFGLESISNTINSGHFRVRVGADYKIGRASIYFDQHVYMEKSSGITFAPHQAEWYAGVKLRISDKVSLKVEHLCIHPVLNQRSESISRMYGGYDMVSLSYGY